MEFLKKLWDLFWGLASLAFIGFVGWAIFSSSSSISSEAEKPSKPVFSQPAQALPYTGDNTANFVNGVAPLKIRTSGNGGYNYFVKIVQAYSNN